MTPVFVETEIWPRKKWWAAIILAFGLQVGLVLWLGDRSPISSRSPAGGPVIFLAENAPARLPTFTDPLLFSAANPHGFSGAVWMNNPKLEFQASDWKSPPIFLALPTHQLTNVISSLIKFDSTPNFAVVERPEPQLTSPRPSLPGPLAPPQSRLQVQGDLARREMVTPVALPGWAHTDILPNSVVEVAVDMDGNPVSANLLSSCGLKEAAKDPDSYALNVARTLRFLPIRGPVTGPAPGAVLTWGKLVFAWQTVTLPATNLPTQTP